jgi:hypothetical protein
MNSLKVAWTTEMRVIDLKLRREQIKRTVGYFSTATLKVMGIRSLSSQYQLLFIATHLRMIRRLVVNQSTVDCDVESKL